MALKFWILFAALLVSASLLFSGEANAHRPCNINWFDEFSYGQPTRALNGNGGWSGSAGEEIAAWDNWCAVIKGGTGDTDAAVSGLNYHGVDGVIWIHINILGYNDSSVPMWNIWIDDEEGRNHVRLHGSCNWLVGRSGGVSTSTRSLANTQFSDIDIKINTSTRVADFYDNGTWMGQLSYPNGQSSKVDRIRFERLDSPSAAGLMILIGDIYMGEEDVTPPPTPYTPYSPGTCDASDKIKFVWPEVQDACSGLAGYHVQIGNAPGGSDVANGWIGKTNYYEFTGDRQQTYYCRVAAKDIAGNVSEWSQVGSSAQQVHPPVMQVDGEPFFPLGYYTSTCFSSANQARDYFAVQRAQGMNTVLSCYGVWGNDSCMVSVMEGAALADMKVAMEVNRWAVRGDPGYPPSLIDHQVDLLKDYPNFLGWYLIDEPETMDILPSTLQARYDQIKSRDPNHSIWAVHYAYPSMYPSRPALDYLAAEPPPYCDVLMTDTYPVTYGSAEFSGPLWYVALESKAHTQLAIATGKEAYINVPQVQGHQPYNTRLPTYPEQRYLLYAPIVEGSRGLMLWMYNAYTTEEHLNNVVAPIAREITHLIPAVMSNSTALCITSNRDYDPTGRGINDVSYMIGEDSRGGYLIAANNTAATISVTFNLMGEVLAQRLPMDNSAVPVLYESRQVTAQYVGNPNERILTDTFSPYDVNIYRIYELSNNVFIDLGSPDISDGMTHPQADDGNTVAVANMVGVNCRRNADPGAAPPDNYFYFAVDDDVVFQFSRPDLQIMVSYYDSGTGSLELQYDSASTPYASGGFITLTGSNTWKTHTFHLTDAYFGNRQSGGADFRIAGDPGMTFYLDTITVIPGEAVPPGPVTGFTATSGNGQVTLNWANPTDPDLVGVMIRYKTGSYPSSPSDGGLLVDRPAVPGSPDSYVHSGFDNITYYYTAFSYDNSALYTPAYASASPTCGPAVSETFNTYSDGALGGQGGWTTTGNASAQVQSLVAKGGTGKSVLMDTVAAGTSIGNTITFTPRSQGYYYISFDARHDSVGGISTNIVAQVNVNSSDTATDILRFRLQKDRIVVWPATFTFFPIQTGTWYNVKLGINVNAPRSFDVWVDGSQIIEDYPWNPSGTDISRIVMSSSRITGFSVQQAYIDNLSIESRLPSIAEVKDEGDYTLDSSTLRFSFDPVTCAGGYRYCIGTAPGSSDIGGWTPCASGEVTAGGLSLAVGQLYFISVQPSTVGGSWGELTASDGIMLPLEATIPEAKRLEDGSVRAIRGAVVSAVFSDCFYIQNQVGPYGIKVVSSAAVNPGDLVDVVGTINGAGSERYIDLGDDPLILITQGPGVPDPVAMNNKDLGGEALHPLAPGVVDGVGPNNIGLLVRCWGRVSDIDGTTYRISDGSGVKVTVVAPDLMSVPEDGDYALIVGISSLDTAGERQVRVPQ